MTDLDSGAPTFVDLAVDFDASEIRRLLGYNKGAEPHPRVEASLAEMQALAESLIEPRGVYRIAGRDDVESVEIPRVGARLAIGITTIGPQLEARVEQLSRERHSLHSFILDAIGSVAVEGATENLDAIICAQLAATEHVAGRRISPGYGKWALERQRDLFALLPADELGVTLNSAMMMIPRKSVSFAVLLRDRDQAGGRHSPRQRCAACEMVDCAFRRQ